MTAVATWADGVFLLGTDVRHELAGRSVRGLALDHEGALLAIVDGTTLRRRDPRGEWRTLATSTASLSACVALPDGLLVGTDDARVLRLDPTRDDAALEPIRSFDEVEGRESWYAGTAIVDGRVVGPPLGVRSMSATCDGAAILVNVHVGGIVRSTDGGRSWHPTIDIEADVHEVRAHPERAEIVAAAAAVGLCVSTDGGASWSTEAEGLHAAHCLAVGLTGDEVLVSAGVDPFTPEGAVYRRALSAPGPLSPVGGGLPRWLEGPPDTACIATREDRIALVDKGGHVHVSPDRGASWSSLDVRVPGASGVVLA
ncbi:MAG: WD40/YVTN/BNR-like repeat-containing protein [Sandaracinaceae bacterium]